MYRPSYNIIDSDACLGCVIKISASMHACMHLVLFYSILNSHWMYDLLLIT